MPKKTQALPQSNSTRWYGTAKQASKRLLLEAEAMQLMFAKGKTTTIDLPQVQWDTDHIQIFTHGLRFGFTQTSSHPLKWEAEFSMTDSNGLSNKEAVWTMYIFYPAGYPSAAPEISIKDGSMGRNGEVKKGNFVTAPNHILPGKTIDGVRYSIICHYDHRSGSVTRGHDPARTNTVMHATRAIRWLRAALYSQKQGYMPDM